MFGAGHADLRIRLSQFRVGFCSNRINGVIDFKILDSDNECFKNFLFQEMSNFDSSYTGNDVTVSQLLTLYTQQLVNNSFDNKENIAPG